MFKYCSNHYVTTGIRVKLFVQQIWLTIEKSSVWPFWLSLLHLIHLCHRWHLGSLTFHIIPQLSDAVDCLNSLSNGPGRPGCHFKTAIFNLLLLIGIFTSSKDNAFRWMPWDLTDDKSTLVQVMAWCHQATSYYLSQCWPRSMSPYGVTRPQWVNGIQYEFSGDFLILGTCVLYSKMS